MADLKPFVNGRDSNSVPSFVLDPMDTRRYANTFVGGEVVTIPIVAGDSYALFFPTTGAYFRFAESQAKLAVAAAVTGTPMTTVDFFPPHAAIRLESWLAKGITNIYLTTSVPQTIAVEIYAGRV